MRRTRRTAWSATRRTLRRLASIAAVGLALSRDSCAGGTRVSLHASSRRNSRCADCDSFTSSPHGPEPDSTGYKGFYYHFLDMKSGRRVWECELSTIDSAFLFAGMLTCAAFFDGDAEDERRSPKDWPIPLYGRADWQWALNGGASLSHGWKPETGFLPDRWTGYDEGLLLYLLGLGSPTFPVACGKLYRLLFHLQVENNLRP